jgi:hypothetical protein
MMNDLAVEHRAALSLIYPLADTLQMKLFYNATPKGVRIRGAQKMYLPIDSKGETLPFEIKVHASTVGDNEAWVLMRVRGELWVLLGYLKQGREVQLCMVDASKAHFGPVTADSFSGLSLSEVLGKIGGGVVASYYRLKEESEWRRLDDVLDSVVTRQAGETPEGDRPAVETGADSQPGS